MDAHVGRQKCRIRSIRNELHQWGTQKLLFDINQSKPGQKVSCLPSSVMRTLSEESQLQFAPATTSLDRNKGRVGEFCDVTIGIRLDEKDFKGLCSDDLETTSSSEGLQEGNHRNPEEATRNGS
ncbi:hypothetical protein CEXT_235591 [Caerostris extrusa]|uniref:Uncharacterized protein n=1 Tax=Caerostris extrusa TaxID=172846 RepID=A0AAV4WL73_CAEEX|nr:hypothetical protein CEXT_235591 [Caerostris extrusa]